MFDASTSMKCIALLLFTLLGERSFGAETESSEKVDIDFIPNEYNKAVKKAFAPPSFENGDHYGGAFEKAYTKAITDYGTTLMIDIYNEASNRTRELIDSVQKDAHKLHECFESIKENNADSTCLDVDLKVLTKQLKKYLTLSPGNVGFKPEELPHLPHQPVSITKIKNSTKDDSVTKIFRRLNKELDEDFTSGYALITAMYLEGWRSVRPDFNIAQMQFRNEFLNGPIMKAYTEVAEEVLKDQEFIQNEVDKETWDSFKDNADRVITISKDYCASKKQ